MTRIKALLSWSSGKDAAWALYVLRQSPDVEVVGLLTTTNEAFDRVAMHGVREVLLEAQAEAVGLPLWKVPLPWPCTNEAYEGRMAAVCNEARAQGIEAMAFGDLFLEDVRDYRIQKLAGTGLRPPLSHLEPGYRGPGPGHGGCGPAGHPGLRGSQGAARGFRRTGFRCGVTGGIGAGCGPLRGAGRVPHLRLGWPHVQATSRLPAR